PWRAAFAGAGDDEAASATGNLTVLAALRVEADPAALVAGAPWLTGHATLDAGGPAPLSSLSLDGQPVGVDETGAFRLALGNATARVRALSFHARAPGGHGVAPLDQDLGVLVLQPSRLAIPAPPEDLAPGSHVTLSAALDDALGPLAGETISWSLGNRTLGHVATGPDGVARLDATIPHDAPGVLRGQRGRPPLGVRRADARPRAPHAAPRRAGRPAPRRGARRRRAPRRGRAAAASPGRAAVPAGRAHRRRGRRRGAPPARLARRRGGGGRARPAARQRGRDPGARPLRPRVRRAVD